VECRPHRNQRMILRHSHRVLSFLLSFPRSVFRPSISCMGCERSSGCCVILPSRFIDATLICPHFRFMPDDGTHQPHLYLIVSIRPPLWISSRVCVFPPSLPRRCVFGLSCSRSYRMFILLSTFGPFRCVYFYPTFLLLFRLYSPP
jgi:hypothetical protein